MKQITDHNKRIACELALCEAAHFIVGTSLRRRFQYLFMEDSDDEESKEDEHDMCAKALHRNEDDEMEAEASIRRQVQT